MTAARETAFDLGKGLDILPQAPVTVQFLSPSTIPKGISMSEESFESQASCPDDVCFIFLSPASPYWPCILGWRGRQTWYRISYIEDWDGENVLANDLGLLSLCSHLLSALSLITTETSPLGCLLTTYSAAC